MKLLLCLGNPGKQYEWTRHNIGFMAADFVALEYNMPAFSYKTDFKAYITDGIVHGEKTLIAKPQTFMNLSGDALIKIQHFYKLDVSDILVIFDDKDMEFEKMRLRMQGTSAGHNGLKDIEKKLWTQNYARIKIWVANDMLNKMDTAKFVLSPFAQYEKESIPVLFNQWLLPLLEEFYKHKDGK